ncbi:MAG: hypothetical protein H3C53_13145 [Trueperaceae bacterium]|nr:hypothetical protein [Trueperaceae bacterium]
MKRILITTLLAALALASAQGTLAPLPADGRFDAPVEFSTGAGGELLSTMITALAKAIDLTAVTDDVPEKTIVYDIGDPKPFRQVWNLVLTLNDLDYVLLDNDIVVVGSPASVARLRAPAAPETATETAPAPADLEQRFYRVNTDPDQVVEILQRAMPGLDAQALPGVHSIMVLATESDHDRVGRLLAQFDTAAEQVHLEQRTYFLSNAVARDLADVLQKTGIVTTDAEGNPGQSVDFTVVAEPRANALIVTGTNAVQARFAELIPQLDQRRQQVNVQVRIQEVAHSITYDLGLDITGGLGQLSASILDTGLRFIFDSAAAVSSFNIGAVLDALETQGLSRRVDDGNITVLDNQTGHIQSGGTILISLPGASENIEREIPYGVQLEITPRVANDGSVTLVIDAKVEDLLSAANDPNFVHLSNRSVTSTINLEPGQTALLGGLMQNQFKLTKKRVPVLGYIPIIGELFGSTTSEDETTDLLLIVTAQVVD